MYSFIRGAINFIQGEVIGSTDHPLVGKGLVIGNIKLRVKSVIAEGGFAVVLSAQDHFGRQYAVKQQKVFDKETLNAISNEISVMKELNGHPNIVGFVNTTQTKISNGGSEFLILMDLCTGGSVIDLIRAGPLSTAQILRVFYAACRAVKHMHCRAKPITHRDIKVENLLFNDQGIVKLCDFGSSTRAIFHPDDSWSSIQRITLIEEMQRNTTPMYRAPEISDEYMNMPVGPQQDIWALGCVLFYLCYRVHPFEDSAKLRIINAKYTIPADDTTYTMFIPLIQSCLRANPLDRPTIADLVERIEVLAVATEINPSEEIFKEHVPLVNLEAATEAVNLETKTPRKPFQRTSVNSEPLKPSNHATPTSDPLADIFGCSSTIKNTPLIDPFDEFMNSTGPFNSSFSNFDENNRSTPKSTRPNYGRNVFESLNDQQPKSKMKANKDIFSDLLTDQGFTSFNVQTPKSMADLLQKKEIDTMDSINMKIRDWSSGKEKNIRALLLSLNDVLWEDAGRWQQPTMIDLLEASQIKKWYRKACLIVHPDKHTDTTRRELAHAVFTQLNIAWLAYKENSNV